MCNRTIEWAEVTAKKRWIQNLFVFYPTTSDHDDVRALAPNPDVVVLELMEGRDGPIVR